MYLASPVLLPLSVSLYLAISNVSAPPLHCYHSPMLLLLSPIKIALQARRWLVFGFVHVSSGAFSWCRVWGALQAGSIWGYEPLPPPLPGHLHSHVPQGSGGDGALKKWSLAPTEGPERARIRMHQDFELSVALSEHEASVAAAARKNETAVRVLERSSAATAGLSDGTY